MKELTEKYFGSIPRGEGKPFIFPTPPALEKPIIIQRPAPDMPPGKASIYLGFLGPASYTSQSSDFNCVNFLLGDGWSSYLLRELRMKRGLTYHASSNYEGPHNVGSIVVQTQVDSERLEETIDAIFSVFDGMKTTGIPPQEVARTKKKLRYEIASNEHSHDGAINAVQKLWEYGITLEQYKNMFNLVTTETVQKTAQKFLPERNGGYALLIRDGSFQNSTDQAKEG